MSGRRRSQAIAVASAPSGLASDLASEIAAAVSAIRERVAFQPALAIILGSGLGALGDAVGSPVRIPYADIPGFPPPGVAGHSGTVIAGQLEGRAVIAFAGRFHLYEGHSAVRAAFPVRVAHALGARVLVVSNAAGGINPTFGAGTLMAIADHINLMWRNPLVGPVARGEARFPDMSEPYDTRLRADLHRVALAQGIRLTEGVYGALQGPTYETPAEVRMLARLGADAVGMSTVPEVIAARALGMRVAGISCISNVASGLALTQLSHAEVLEAVGKVAADLERLVRAWLAEPGALDAAPSGASRGETVTRGG